MVERIQSKRRRIMKEFVIRELSAVDRPAQGHALAVLMKRADADFDKALSTKAETNYRDAGTDSAERCGACEYFDGESGCSKVAGEIAADGLCDLFEKESTEGDSPMTDAEKKQLDELQKSVADLTKQLEAATTKDVAKKAADLQAALEKAQAQLTEATEKLEKADASKADAETLAKMSDAEKEYMAGLDGAAKMKFMQSSPEDRKKMMAKSADADPVVYKSESSGEEFRKSDDPRLVKMAKAADEDRKIAKEERELRETAELTKRADDDLKNFSGETPAKVEVLRAITKMDEAPRKALEDMLKAGGKAISAAFEKIGHSSEMATKSAGDFNKRVDEVMARDKLPRIKAMEKAAREFPAEHAAFQATGAQLSN